MYKWAVRTVVRHGIERLNAGDPSFLLRLAHRDAEIAFPGENSWARMHRTVVKGRERHATHRGIDECRSFADRFVETGLHIDIEDILVNGGPWRARVAVRGTDHLAGPDGDEYNNRLVAFLEIRWGRLVAWEDYEDTERVAAWDRAQALA